MKHLVRASLALALVAAALAVAAAQSAPTVYRPGNGVSLPQVTKQVKADYTKEARDQRIEGDAVLDVVVLDDGTVGDVAVTKSVDSVYGLDREAVKAMKQWLFKPGMKDGKAVAVRVNVEMTFSLR